MKESKVVILLTSDIHGSALPINYSDNRIMPYGLVKIASVIGEIRNKSNNTILIDNGDLIQGTPLTYYYCKVDSTGPNPMIRLLNYLSYDAAVVGNHEFNYGRHILDRAVEESNFPWLAANIINSFNGECAFGRPYIIKEFQDGVKIGILGVTTKYIPNWEDSKHIEGITFEDPVEAADRWVRYLREIEKVDVVVVSYHGGFERDVDSGRPIGKLTGENQGYELCEKVKGIDVLLTGHQHKVVENKSINGVLILQPGSHGKYLGAVKLALRFEKRWRVTGRKTEVVAVQEAEEDAPAAAIIKEFEDRVQSWLDKPIGIIKGGLEIKNPLKARLRDNPFIEFINRVQMKVSGAEISCTSLFTDEIRGMKEKVTMRDIVSTYIYPNTLRVLRVKGKDIKAALERSAGYFERYEGGQVRTKKKEGIGAFQPYNYDMWEGIEYKLDISKAEGFRVVELKHKGKPIDIEGEYEVVLNNYRAAGGGEYDMFKDKSVIKDIPTDMSELIASYVLDTEVIGTEIDNNWEVIY
ncbi:MAG: bifunctional metallophosphatase/5'-nucleotidase [Bacillota bacterium]|nr:bifunctional metallophosphatase/5'-nucleotidase [Bacillota bacterium]